MPKDNVVNPLSSLNHFLQELDNDYRQSLTSISLFNPQNTALWSKHQQKSFASIFYHLRGHFINFVWYIANFSNNPRTKEILINNIHEELGVGNRISHEELYALFAGACGADIQDEIINETHYVPFAREFNKAHLHWLSTHDQEERIAAFASYERLDNIDYPFLVIMAKSLNLRPTEIKFFNVHIDVTHFDSTLEMILPIWEKSPDKVIRSFQFIYSHQLQMWANLSKSLFH